MGTEQGWVLYEAHSHIHNSIQWFCFLFIGTLYKWNYSVLYLCLDSVLKIGRLM